MYIHQERSQLKMSIRERMLAEVQRSIETAYALCDLLDRYDVDLEVHADINTNPMFKSNLALLMDIHKASFLYAEKNDHSGKFSFASFNLGVGADTDF